MTEILAYLAIGELLTIMPRQTKYRSNSDERYNVQRK